MDYVEGKIPEVRDNSTTSADLQRAIHVFGACRSFELQLGYPSQFILDDLAAILKLTLSPSMTIKSGESNRHAVLIRKPANDFSHTGIVVWPTTVLIFMLTVIFLLGLPLTKTTMAETGLVPRRIGVIEGFDANWNQNLGDV